MLVDLGRNDVGKVAQMGSVSVDRLMEVERYSHVMHISSTVTGKLLPELNAWDVMRAALPAGTVSGAPKVDSHHKARLPVKPAHSVLSPSALTEKALQRWGCVPLQILKRFLRNVLLPWLDTLW